MGKHIDELRQEKKNKEGRARMKSKVPTQRTQTIWETVRSSEWQEDRGKRTVGAKHQAQRATFRNRDDLLRAMGEL